MRVEFQGGDCGQGGLGRGGRGGPGFMVTQSLQTLFITRAGSRFALVTLRCSEVPEGIPLGAWLLLMSRHFSSVVMVIKLHRFLCSSPLARSALRGHVLPPEEAVSVFTVKVEELGTVSSLGEVPTRLCSRHWLAF